MADGDFPLNKNECSNKNKMLTHLKLGKYIWPDFVLFYLYLNFRNNNNI